LIKEYVVQEIFSVDSINHDLAHWSGLHYQRKPGCCIFSVQYSMNLLIQSC